MLDCWALESGEGLQESELRKSEGFITAHPRTTYGISFIPQTLPAGSGPGFSFTDPRRCRLSMPDSGTASLLLSSVTSYFRFEGTGGPLLASEA